MEDLNRLPNPSQMDDWFLYRRYVRQQTTVSGRVAPEGYADEFDLNDAAIIEWSFDDVFL